MDQPVLVGLVNNVALLLALVLVYETFAKHQRGAQSLSAQLLTGITLGAIAVAIMLSPVRWAQGVIFDTRTVLLGTVGLFFPTITAIVAMAISAAYRLYLGGGGTLMGVATILLSGATGIAWQRLRRSSEKETSFRELYAFGLVVHALMLLSMALLPQELVLSTLKKLGPPVILLYPVATALLGGLLGRRAENLRRDITLKESEARYRALFDLSPDGVVVVDPSTASFLEFNEQVCRQLGYTREEFAQLSIPDIELRESPADVQERVAQIMKIGYAEFDTMQRTKRGEARHVHVKARYSEIGSRAIYHCIWRDITREKRAELIADARVHLLQYSLSHSMDEFLTETLDCMEELTGSQIGFFHLVEEEGKNLTLHAWSTRTSRDFCRAQGAGAHYGIERAGVWVDCLRERRPVIHNDYESLPHRKGLPPGHAAVIRELTIPIIRADAIVAILGIGNKPTVYTEEDVSLVSELADLVWDAAENKAAQEARQKSEQRFALSMEATNDGLWDWDVPTDTSYFSPAYYRMLGYEPGEFPARGATWAAMLHPEDQERCVALATSCINGSTERFEMEFRLRTKDGNWRWILGRGKCIERGVDGKAVRIIGTHVDIQDIKRIEAEQELLRAQLLQAQKMEAIGTLAGGIAHDFNNILGAILGYTELSVGMLQPSDPVRENLQEVLVASGRAKDLVQQILAFGRKGEKKVVSVDTGVLVTEAMKLLVSVIPKTISIELEIDLAAGHVLADPTELHQVVMNLCTNAFQAVKEEKGLLRVRLSSVSVDPLEAATVQGLSVGEYVRLDVIDNGVGMEEQTMARIFDPYFTTKAVGKGTGLGLALVHGIVTSLGGAISVRSTPGIGTSFSVYLRRNEPAKIESADSRSISSLHGNASILVLDDEPALARLAAKMLESLGYKVRIVTDPLEAISVFESHPLGFDAIVTDQTMPGMTGAEFVRRAKVARPDVAAVMCTGYSDLIDEDGAKKIGIAAYVQKPYDKIRLGQAVAQALGGG